MICAVWAYVDFRSFSPRQPTITVKPVAPVVPEVVVNTSVSAPALTDEFEFSDTSAMTCLLCARQFKSLDQLRRHNKESELHKVR